MFKYICFASVSSICFSHLYFCFIINASSSGTDYWYSKAVLLWFNILVSSLIGYKMHYNLLERMYKEKKDALYCDHHRPRDWNQPSKYIYIHMVKNNNNNNNSLPKNWFALFLVFLAELFALLVKSCEANCFTKKRFLLPALCVFVAVLFLS